MRGFCRSSSHSFGCDVAPEQQQAKHWRVSQTMEMSSIPRTVEVELRAQAGHQPDRFVPGSSALDVRFDLGPPLENGTAGCVSIPVNAITEAEVPLDAGGG